MMIIRHECRATISHRLVSDFGFDHVSRCCVVIFLGNFSNYVKYRYLLCTEVIRFLSTYQNQGYPLSPYTKQSLMMVMFEMLI